MKSIAEIDHNFRSEGRLKLDDVCFYNVKAKKGYVFGYFA